jgi:hypothetical protein
MRMSTTRRRLGLLIAVVLCSPAGVRAASYNLHGQLAAWFNFEHQPEQNLGAGLRYEPRGDWRQEVGSGLELGLEGVLDAWAGLSKLDGEPTETDTDIDVYRLWARAAAPRWELRAGLQKISFGSAMLLRPLMWFDQTDVRDPLKLTRGIHALLGRYSFQNNASVWLWSMLGNDEPRGWDTAPSDPDVLELGGRVQVPVPAGEVAGSYHRRTAEQELPSLPGQVPGRERFGEQRWGVDGRWDVGVGFWVEACAIHQDHQLEQLRWQRLGNIGVDYTFDVGNGLTTLVEQFVFERSAELGVSGTGPQFTAGSMQYLVGPPDRLRAIVYYEWEADRFYRMLSWERQYDHWSFHAAGFWNPEDARLFPQADAMAGMAGRGFQLLVAYDH